MTDTEPYVCENARCGVTFDRTTYRAQAQRRRTCSRECAVEVQSAKGERASVARRGVLLADRGARLGCMLVRRVEGKLVVERVQGAA